MSDSIRAIPCQKPDIICKSAGLETLLYDPARDVVHILNPTALAVWDLCDGQHTPAQIAAELRARFATVEGQDVAGDVQAVLALLHREGLITIQ